MWLICIYLYVVKCAEGSDKQPDTANSILQHGHSEHQHYHDMKIKTIVTALYLSMIALTSTAQTVPDANGYIVSDGQLAPDFSVELAEGGRLSLSELRGRVVMLQFTASWCGVCRREMPFIESDIYQPHKDDPGFVLVGIDRDEPLDKVQAFAKSTGISYPLALDPGADVFSLYSEREAGVTRNVLIGPDGTILMRTRLYKEKEFGSLTMLIDSLLQQKGYTTLAATDFQASLRRSDVQLVDVRTEKEYDEGHIARAIQINALSGDFASNAAAKLDKTKMTAVYCRSGKRSADAASQLTEMGFRVINLDGGILQWQKDGMPVTKEKNCCEPAL